MMAPFLLKVTLLFALALGCLPLMRRASAVARHLICACAMAGALLLPLTMLAAPAWQVSRVLLSLWISGIAIFLLHLASGYWRLANVLRIAAPASGLVYADV
jgi:hypothetical protein